MAGPIDQRQSPSRLEELRQSNGEPMSRHPTPHAHPSGFACLENDEYRRLFEECRDAIYIATPAGRVADINSAGLRLFGYGSKEEMLALESTRDLYWNQEDHHCAEQLFVEQGLVEDFEIEVKTRDGQRLRVLESASAIRDQDNEIIGCRVALRDVTELRKLEEQLRRSQKMEAVGRLAGGVAHDFNNLLTAINGYSELSLARMSEDEPWRPALIEIRSAGKRAAELTRRLLSLSRQQMVSPRRLDLNRAVADMDKLMRRVLGEDIELSTELDPELRSIFADQGQIEQMILNLAVNARDAMPKGGKLSLMSSNTELPQPDGPVSMSQRQGPHVLLTVEDSGCGIDTEVQERIFEPYFSTKDAPHSSGLGLSVVQSIMQQSKGHIDFDSQVGEGARFHLFFPALSPEASEDEPATQSAESPRGSETVLLVEDDEGVRAMVRQILELQGYRVLSAANARQALTMCDEFPGRFDLLLTDIVMPGMSGPELAEDLASRLPGLKILFMSGYTDRHDAVRAVADRKAAFLPKPFTPQVLAHRLREVLARS